MKSIMFLLLGCTAVCSAATLTGRYRGVTGRGLDNFFFSSEGITVGGLSGATSHQPVFPANPSNNPPNVFNPAPIGSGLVVLRGARSYLRFGAFGAPEYELGFGSLYDLFITFEVPPWTGGTTQLLNPNPNYIERFTVTGGIAPFTAQIEVRERLTNACVWCDSYAGTALVSGEMSSIDGFVQYDFNGESVPEPGTMVSAGLALALGLVWKYRRRSSPAADAEHRH